MRRSVVILIVCALGLSGCSISLGRLGSSEDQPGGSDPPLTDVTIEQNNAEPPHSSVSGVVEDVLPSVVNVRVKALAADPLGGTTESRAQGSGVIIDPNGVIITNNHVVEGATSVTVVFTDDHESVDGTVLGTDPEKDLAVVKVDADGLDAITLGRSSQLKLGDDVIALGFPLGLGGPTVTKGIVSGLDRNITVGGAGGGGSERLESVLQTDAAINPGNSGGALVNRSGQLVGINTAAASAGSAENVGFAISIDAALPVVEQILREPPDKRAWIGVSITDMNRGVATQPPFEGIDPDVKGAGIVATFDNGPARAAGLRAGEVITKVDDTPISKGADLTSALADHDPGETVTLTLVSADGTRTVDVELGERPVTLDG